MIDQDKIKEYKQQKNSQKCILFSYFQVFYSPFQKQDLLHVYIFPNKCYSLTKSSNKKEILIYPKRLELLQFISQLQEIFIRKGIFICQNNGCGVSLCRNQNFSLLSYRKTNKIKWAITAFIKDQLLLLCRKHIHIQSKLLLQLTSFQICKQILEQETNVMLGQL